MKLEVGKSYRNRLGEVVKVVKLTGEASPYRETHPFSSEYGRTYREDGKYDSGGAPDSLDLIAPADDPVITYLKCPILPKLPSFGDLCDAISTGNWKIVEPIRPLHPIVAMARASRDRAMLGPDGRPARMLTTGEIMLNEAHEQAEIDCLRPSDAASNDSNIDERIRECVENRENDVADREWVNAILRKHNNPGPYPPQRGCFGVR